MAAHIRTTMHTSPGGPVVGPVLTDQSREDLRKSYQIICESVDAATTYAWSLSFIPKSSGPAAANPNNFDGTPSTAVLLPPEGSTTQTCKFNVDWEGSYLLRLVVDAGLPTESTQFVRLRRLTQFAELKLVSAGERRDQSGVVPVDATPEGWANDQNQNVQRLMLLVRRLSTGGRVLYVDANRGRNNTATPNEPTNISRIPGPDSVARDESGIRMAAEGFGDFSSITEAVAYAMGAVGRGEPVASTANPYRIMVAPGYYEENLVLQPHIHLVGDTVANQGGMDGVYVSTTSALNAHHEFTGTAADSELLIRNVTLVNGGSTAQPVLLCAGQGTVFLDESTITQNGLGVTQGPALGAISTGPMQIGLRQSQVISNANADALRYAVTLTGPSLAFTADTCRIEGESGIQINPTLQTGVSVQTTRTAVVARNGAGHSLFGYAETIQLLESTIEGTVDITDDGVGPVAFNVNMRCLWTLFEDDLTVRTAGTSGDIYVYWGACAITGTVTFPDGPPTAFSAIAHDRSILYADQYTPPETGIGPTVPVTKRLGVGDAQNALDKLVMISMPNSVSPFYSLDTAYDGLATITPFLYGHGLGRNILADYGAVRISGATAPIWTETDGLLRGGLQTEGTIDSGPLVGDGLGSEINLNPNPMGGGAILSMGRGAWPNDSPGTPRPPMCVVQAGSAGVPFDEPYDLYLQTRSLDQSLTGAMGNVVVRGGYANKHGAFVVPTAGSVWIEGGSSQEAGGGTNPAGDIVLMPGQKPGPVDSGRIYVVNPDAATAPVLIASGLYLPADPSSGFFWIRTPEGVQRFAVGAADPLATVVTTVNTTGLGVTALDLFGVLVLLGTPGPGSSIVWLGSTSNALTLKLGDLRVASGAVYFAGTAPERVGISCPAPDQLQVHGTVIRPYRQVTNLMSPYTVQPGDEILGAQTVGGGGAWTITINLVDERPGRILLIRDEESNAGVNNILVSAIAAGGWIDGPGGVLNAWPIGVNHGFVKLYQGADVGGNPRWYVC